MMREWIKDVIQAFIESNISTVREYTLKFAQQITKPILNNNFSELKQLVDASCEIRDEIEIDQRINRNKEFYFGYWYAYENIARRIIEYNETNQEISYGINANEKLRKLIKYLGTVKAARQKDIAEYLNMKPNELSNFMETDTVKQADILSKDKIGRNVIYSLNPKGNKYLKDQLSENRKSYSKSDLMRLLDYFSENKSKNLELIAQESPLFDDAIINKLYSLLISEEITNSSKQKKKTYIQDRIKRQTSENRNSIITGEKLTNSLKIIDSTEKTPDKQLAA